MTIFRDLETSDNDIFPHLVALVYHQLLRMENRIPDEDGLMLFDKGVISLLKRSD